MSETEYVFDDTEGQQERNRLQAIESVFDPASQRRILSTGFSRGWTCLEVGAGAGSIASWMAAVAGIRGRTTAIDINTRFLDRLPPAVRLLAADIRTAALEPESFDLVHARYVLIHLPDFQVALDRMLMALRPGGWLVLEEPDFSAARPISGDEQDMRSVAKVNRAILRMFSEKRMDHSLGIRLPSLLQSAELKNLTVENDGPIAQGRSGIAQMMKMSARQLQAKYLATSEVAEQDIENYCTFAENSASWAIYYATVACLGRK